DRPLPKPVRRARRRRQLRDRRTPPRAADVHVEAAVARRHPARLPGPAPDVAGLLVRAESLLQRGELVAQRLRQAVAGAGEGAAVVAGLGQVVGRALGVDGQQRLERLGRQLETLRVEVLEPRHEPDRGLDGADCALAATEDPLEHAAILAEARPQELAVVTL